MAMDQIAREGRGIILYLRQEGRGIGLRNKLKAYALQDHGLDTVEANEHLGFPADLRTFGPAVRMLKDLGVSQVRLLTNNPRKLETLVRLGIEVVERVPIVTRQTRENSRYLNVKRDRLGHLFLVNASGDALTIH
jgi:GTP cyclohydrolase II